MKKILSGILALSMMFSGPVFNVANAAEIDSKYVTATDNTPNNQYRAFISSTGTPDAGSTYDWFTAKKAMDLDHIKKNLDADSGYWVGTSGVPYSLDLKNNGAGTDIWDNAYLTEGYYSEIKLLIGKVDDLGNSSIFSYSINHGDTTGIQGGNAEDDSVTAELLDGAVPLFDVSGGTAVSVNEKGELWEYTITLNDTARATKINDVWHEAAVPYWDNIVLGVTGVKMTTDDWKALIERKLAAYDTKPDEAAFAEIEGVMAIAAEEGFDVETADGYDKYLEWKNAPPVEPEYTAATYAADASRYKAFLSENAERASDGTYDWFMRDVAIDKNKMPGNLNAEGYWVGSSGVPYKFEIADNAAGVDFWSTAFLPEDYYSKVKVLVAVADVSDKTYGFGYSIDKGVQEDYGYSYGTYSRDIIETVPALDVSSGKAVANNEKIELVEYTINLNDAAKATKISEVYHRGQGDAEYDNIALAITGVGLTGTEWIPAIKAEIAALPEDAEAVDEEKFAEITGYIEKAFSQGVEESDIENIDKYNTLKAALEEMNKQIVEGAEVVAENEDITINVKFTEAMPVADITKTNIILECGREAVDYAVEATNDGMGAAITLKNSIATADSYSLNINLAGTHYSKVLDIPKPVSVENYSAGTITAGANLAFSAEVKNNTYTSGKKVKLIAAVYDGEGRLQGVNSDATEAALAKGASDTLTASIAVPSTATAEWTAKAFIWADDTVTPLSPAQKKEYAINKLNDTTKDITAAFIGGSITEEGNYSKPFVEKWQEERTGTITSINAGIGGTTSVYVAMRLYEDVLSKKPDVVFVESTLNDGEITNEQAKKNVEAIIRQVADSDYQPVVVFIHIPDRRQDNEVYRIAERAAAYDEVLTAYGLNALDAHDLVVNAVADNGSWDTYIPADNVHPNATQGEAIATLMYDEFKKNFDTYVKNMTVVAKQFGSDDYIKPVAVSSANAVYRGSKWAESTPDNVVTEGYGTTSGARFESFMGTRANDAKMTFNFSGTKLLVTTYMSNAGGYADYKIINAETGEVESSGNALNQNPYLGSDWYENILINVTGLEDTEHILEIKTRAENPGLFGVGEFWVDE